MTENVPECDPNREHPYIYLIGDRLLVYRANLHESAHPQCVAQLAAGTRCENRIEGWGFCCGHVEVLIAGTDGVIQAYRSAFAEVGWLAQRCLDHLDPALPVAAPSDLSPFDPVRDADAIWHVAPRWEKGRVISDPGSHDRPLRSWHTGNCPFGDHLPWPAPTQEQVKDDIFSGEGYGPAQIASYNAFGKECRSEWLPKVRDAAPDLYQMLLAPTRVPYFVDEEGNPCFWYDDDDELADAEATPEVAPEPRRVMLSTGSELASDLSLNVPKQPNVAADPTALYRYFDEDDVLLYIGISGALSTRINGHARGSSWMDFAARSTIERHPTRSAAEAAERTAIEAERPLFNSQYNNAPEAQRRLVEYLISKGRADLLTPAISRG